VARTQREADEAREAGTPTRLSRPEMVLTREPSQSGQGSHADRAPQNRAAGVRPRTR
jgi:hypothetical protein